MADFAGMRASSEFAELLEVSAVLGADPLQVQGPGGNTSLKRDGLMLIKASGTWLADAKTKDIKAEDTERLKKAAEGKDGAPVGTTGELKEAERSGSTSQTDTEAATLLKDAK